jgi:cation diffusion facilitator family transporter
LVVNVGLGANIILALVKTSIGILGGSPALLADGINSTSDVAYGVVVNIFIRLSGKPADHEHPYGHDQMESIAAVVVGAFVVSTAIVIFWNSLQSIYQISSSPVEGETAAGITLWVAILTIVSKVWLASWTNNIGLQIENKAVIALAKDHKNDIFASLAATIGIYFARLGYSWVDPLAGAIVSLVILHTGGEILRDAAADLMATLPGKVLREQIHGLLDSLEGIEEVEEIHAHRFGPYLVVNITIGVDGTLTVAKGDSIASKVETVLLNEVDFMRRVYVHYHPVKTPVGNALNSE